MACRRWMAALSSSAEQTAMPSQALEHDLDVLGDVVAMR